MTAIIEQTLTRNESADQLKYIWSTIVEESPGSTNAIRDIGARTYVVGVFDVVGVHKDHLDDWLMPRLSDPDKLDKIDKFAEDMRDGPQIASPWRD